MPFQAHHRLTCRGTIGASAGAREGFSFGVNMSLGELFDLDATVQFPDVVEDCKAYFGRSDTFIWQGAVLTEVKLAKIGPDGKYLEGARIANCSVPGGQLTGPPTFPYQVSLCVSLNTARRGATGRGRFYLPCPTSSLESDGQLPPIVSELVGTSTRTWLNALNNRPGLDINVAKVVVASRKGYNSNVTGVRVGRVPDTMRSRRRALVEAYGPPVAL